MIMVASKYKYNSFAIANWRYVLNVIAHAHVQSYDHSIQFPFEKFSARRFRLAVKDVTIPSPFDCDTTRAGDIKRIARLVMRFTEAV